MHLPLIVAHRGATQLAPENSLAAFVLAMEMGTDSIEFDVHFSKDEQMVIHHDYYLGRTEHGSGFIGDYSLKELQTLALGTNFNGRFSCERMPALRDALEACKGKVRFEIELRCPTLLFLKSVIDEISRADVVDEVEFTSPHIPLLAQVKSINPDIRTGVFFSPFPAWMEAALGQQHIVDWLALLESQVAHLPMALLTKDFVDRLHDLGFLVHASDLNSKDEIEEAIRLEVDQFSTDTLEMAIRVRDTIGAGGYSIQ